ncbi:hypothetical protein [Desulfospira joergensenii]|uniref:hypothetical protein n=1 Tax=Desulfospira joergensenii TaxID=53329 RepID=UPI0003B40B61|nr:hypothetical protein [Desulfospira joergensenii]
MAQKIAVVVKDVEQQYEALRTSLGLLLEMAEVQMFVLNHEIANMDEAYSENMEFLDEMEGERFTNNEENAEKYGFKFVSFSEIGALLKEASVVIPF